MVQPDDDAGERVVTWTVLVGLVTVLDGGTGCPYDVLDNPSSAPRTVLLASKTTVVLTVPFEVRVECDEQRVRLTKAEWPSGPGR